MKKHKVYISGQITGLPVAEYVEKFSKAEAELKAKGYEVVNPLRYELKPGSRWNEQMKVDIRLLLDCDAIYMLSNWERSTGAGLELYIAEGLGLIINYEKPPKHRDIKTAILTAMGVSFASISEDSRNRWHVYARMIYAHHCKKRGENTQRIAEETLHDQSTICYYLRRYDSEYKYNKEFRAAAEKVATLLSKTWVSCLKPGESSVVTYLKKGTQVYVRGSLSVKTFNSGNGVQAGVNCLVRELQLLGSKQETQNEQQQPATTSTPPIYTPAGSASPFPPENEKDDLPF